MAYDSAIVFFTTKTDKVDLVQAAHMNSAQSELVTIETILGTNVKGDRADLKTRLNNALDADGSLLSGAAYPSPALPSQPFYKTDVNTLYMRNAENNAWLPQGGNLSNVLFHWLGNDSASQADLYGIYEGNSLVTTVIPILWRYMAVKGQTAYTMLTGRFVKISGVSTITIHAKLWANNAGSIYEAILTVDVGGQNNTVKSVESSSPTWVTPSTIDVSSLTNGTVYDIIIQIQNEHSLGFSYCSGLILTGS